MKVDPFVSNSNHMHFYLHARSKMCPRGTVEDVLCRLAFPYGLEEDATRLAYLHKINELDRCYHGECYCMHYPNPSSQQAHGFLTRACCHAKAVTGAVAGEVGQLHQDGYVVETSHALHAAVSGNTNGQLLVCTLQAKAVMYYSLNYMDKDAPALVVPKYLPLLSEASHAVWPTASELLDANPMKHTHVVRTC